MKNAILFTFGMVGIGAVSIVLAALHAFDWRPIGIIVAVFGGIWWGIRSARRERIRQRMIRDYLAEPDE